MAKKKSKSPSQKAKTVAKTTGKVAVAGYAWRLTVTGGAAKRKAQVAAAKSDAKKVGRGAKKTAKAAAGTKPGQKVVKSKGGQATGRAYASSVASGKALAGSGPVEMAKNVKKKAASKKPSRAKAKMVKGRVSVGYMAGKHNLTQEMKGVTDTKSFKAGKSAGKAKRVTGARVGKAATHVGANKGKYAAGAAVGVAAGAGAAYAYKRRKAAKAAGTAGSTYKRRTKSGKVITVKKGKRAKRQPVKAAGRLMVSGSTRYTSTGSTKSHPRLKTWGTVSALGMVAGTAVPGVGSFAGGVAGRKIARSRGWQTRTKKRVTVRAYEKHKAKRGGKR